MLHVTLNGPAAADEARKMYATYVAQGHHAILDVPGELRTNLPERRLSAADVLVSARTPSKTSTTTTPLVA